ncbi:probable polyketide synthase 1 [Antedon mediterranea]|uniref:probable polyketide synthase 1 n=1 Tax=Antedon mediterranea TaxID=105859 RepID=UPI003AF8A461
MNENSKKCPIAIVGIGCRMPGGVTSTEDFWQVLCSGKDCITDVPPERWSIEKFHDDDQTKPGKMVSPKSGFVDGIDKFDNTFFKISPKEASSMDPQQRILLEVTHEAFEDAGIIPDNLDSCGVFVGIGLMDYPIQTLDIHANTVNAYTLTGTAHSVAANRISYVFNLKGPSYAVDTACASSITAMHLACKSLRDNECKVAVLGGVNALILPDTTVGFSALGVLSPDGKCCPFSDTAKGYVRGEGFGTCILKTLDQAMKDNDHIYATIMGTSIGSNGYSQSITMPSMPDQQRIIEETYKTFDVNMADVNYLEAHGTGTPVGDPIEAEAIGKSFGPNRDAPIKIGSVKSNFGHSECAAGAAATIKAALMLHNGYLVPTINYNKPNPKINLKDWKLEVQTQMERLPNDEKSIIGVNSFGFAGALAHAIFQEAPKQKHNALLDPVGWEFGSSTKEGKPLLIPLSAKSSAALTDLAIKWKEFDNEEDALRVVGWQATHRKHHECRVAISASSGSQFQERLEQFITNGSGDGISTGTTYNPEHKICFVFPGQGQQWINMGRKLYQTEPIFRESIKKCDTIFQKISGWSLLNDKGLFNGQKNLLTEENFNDMVISQPALLFLQVGLFDLWCYWGVKPDVVVGHSLGEIAAAYACGGLTLTEAVRVVYHRSKNQSMLKGCGSMAAVRLTLDEAEKMCNKYENLYIAAENAPGSLTLAGSKESINSIDNDVNVKSKKLRVQCAFHTPIMDPMEKPFRTSMKGAVSTPAGVRSVPMFSTLTGEVYDGDFNTDYWWSNIRNRVKFCPAIEGVLRNTNANIFIELSASVTLASSIKQIGKGQGKTDLITLSTGQREQNDKVTNLFALGQLYTCGIDINWDNFTRDAAIWVDIPKYQWQHNSFWIEGEERRNRRLGQDDRTYKGQNGNITFAVFPFLADHVIQDNVIFPAAGYVEYALQSYFADYQIPSVANASFKRVCTWPDNTDSSNNAVGLNLTCVKNGSYVEVTSNNTVYSSCELLTTNNKETKPVKIDKENILKRCTTSVTQDEFYSRMSSVGLNYGTAFQVIEEVMAGDGEGFAYLCPAENNNQRIQTTQLDGCFQLLLSAIGETTTLYLPVAIDKLQMFVPKIPPGQQLMAYANVTECDSKLLVGDIILSTSDGCTLVKLTGVRCQNINGTRSDVDLGECLYKTIWQTSSACMGNTSVVCEVFDDIIQRRIHTDETYGIGKAEKFAPLIRSICASYIRHGLKTVDSSTYNVHPLYIERLRAIAADTSVKTIPFKDLHRNLDELYKAVPELEHEIGMIRNLGDNFTRTLIEPGSAVKLLFRPECLPSYFMDSLTTRLFYKAGTDIIDRAVQKALKEKSVVRVLEIGGRMGGLAQYILEPLKKYGEEKRVEYIFTDLSVTFFMHAESALEEYPFVKYQQLDIEKDLASQGFVPGTVDFIVCMDTIHSVVDVNIALGRIRDLLTDDGLFLMYEATNTHYVAELVFGSLELCWVYQDFRTNTCWLSKEGWVQALVNNGFADVESETTTGEFFHSMFLGRKRSLTVHKGIKTIDQNTECQRYLIFTDRKTNVVADCLSKCLSAEVIIQPLTDINKGILINNTETDKTEVIYLWNSNDSNCHDLFKLFQQVDNSSEAFQKIWVITTDSNNRSQNIEGSKAIGVVRAITNQFNAPVYSIDIESKSSSRAQAELAAKYIMSYDHKEREIAIRDGAYFYPRIIPTNINMESVSTNKKYWQLTQSSSSALASLDDLGVSYLNEMIPDDGKVLVRIKSAALNFKDVMMALGMLNALIKTEEKQFGLELSGIVEKVGKGVVNLKEGDEVIGFGDHCFASHSICDAQLVVKKPSNLTWDESSGIGIIFSTSYHSLIERANLQPGETVLIHSACGGVGLSAIQVARMAKANIICTAGSVKKREYLKEKLGIRYVSDSRSDEFYNDIMQWTSGRGVDVVLNSLSGDLLVKGIECLAPGGRFCEIGKRDILQNSNLQMQMLLENKTFISSQIDIMIDLDKPRASKLLTEVSNKFQNGIFKPIRFEVSSIEEYQEVFARTAKGSHIGKVVFNIPDEIQPPKINPTTKLFKQNVTYIVTGGFGGIGQAMARWLANKGAKHIALVSRRGCRNSSGRRTLKYLEAKGVNVYKYSLDLSIKDNVLALMKGLQSEHAPEIKGVFHLAGFIMEETFQSLTNSEIDNILSSKAGSAQHLHDVTKDMNLEIFFLLSSVTTMCGNSSQSMYIAANNFLDALAAKRRDDGLPALSVQLSPVRGAGYLEDKSGVAQALNMRGHLSLHVDEFLEGLSNLLQSSNQPAAVYLANQDWNVMQMFVYPESMKFVHLATGQQVAKTDCSLSLEDIEKNVKQKMGKLLCVEPETIDVNQPMINYGVDSLMAVEMVTWASKELNVVVSQLDILGGITTKLLLEKALNKEAVLPLKLSET